jgi:DNA-binding transcriptional LysR family regulator
MRLTLRQLEVFAAIARTDNVSRAAEALNMSQSAASSALVELERQFDCPLFDRIGKSLRLNSTGRGLLPQVEDLLAKASEIEGFLAGGKLGPLAVGATLTIGNYLATLIVAEYLQRHPESRVDLKVSNTRHVLDGLIRCELDVGLIEGEANDPDLLTEPWLEDELVVFCAPQHKLAQVEQVSNQQLADESWILRERGSGTRALFDRVVAPALEQVNIQLQLEHTEAIKRVVEAGLGLSCLSRVSLRDAFRRGSLVEIKTPQFNLQRHFYFVQHRQRHISPASRTFLALCRELGNAAEIRLPFVP